MGQDHTQARYVPLVQLPGDRLIDAVSSFLIVAWPQSQFGRQHAAAQRHYQTFVGEGISRQKSWDQMQGQVLLGRDRFVERLTPGLREKRLLKEIPRHQQFATRPTLSRLFGSRSRTDRDQRNEVIRRAHMDHGYSLSEIGQAIDVHYSTISRIVSAQESKNAQIKI